jgi:hypothetical protein
MIQLTVIILKLPTKFLKISRSNKASLIVTIKSTFYKFIMTHIFRYNYHILKDGILIFVCLAESTMKLKICFGFLE